MPYCYPYPYPIYPPRTYYTPISISIPTTPLIHQTPGWNPLHGHDAGSAPPGVATRIVASAPVPSMAIPISWAAPVLPLPLPLALSVPQTESLGACKCYQGVNASATANTALKPEPKSESSPAKPETDGRTTPRKSFASSSSSSSTTSKTKATTKAEPGPLPDILDHANKDKNRDANPAS